jgi:hypothetical protein
MPDFSELAANIEPLRGRGLTRPRHGKHRVGERIQCLDERDEIVARVGIEFGQDTRTESFRRANPGRVQLVDEERQIPFAGAARP